MIGHLKSDHRLDRNDLKGSEGDQVNALLSACGFNVRKLLRAISFIVLRLLGRVLIEVLGAPAEQRRTCFSLSPAA